jgi:NitT/TauT family transport system substrate-binding protein
MKFTTPVLLACLAAPVLVLGLLRYHPWTGTAMANGGVSAGTIHDGPNANAMRELTVGFLPVTCHLTCPVTDFASKTTTSNTNFKSRLFTDFPTVASAFEAKQIQATFMIVPLAMKLREQGVPIKIC